MDTGPQCISGYHDEHWNNQTSRIPQLPQEVRVHMWATCTYVLTCACMYMNVTCLHVYVCMYEHVRTCECDRHVCMVHGVLKYISLHVHHVHYIHVHMYVTFTLHICMMIHITPHSPPLVFQNWNVWPIKISTRLQIFCKRWDTHTYTHTATLHIVFMHTCSHTCVHMYIHTHTLPQVLTDNVSFHRISTPKESTLFVKELLVTLSSSSMVAR